MLKLNGKNVILVVLVFVLTVLLVGCGGQISNEEPPVGNVNNDMILGGY